MCGEKKGGRKTTPRLGGFCHGSVADFKGPGCLPLCQISFFSHPVCPHPSLFTKGEGKHLVWRERGRVEEGWKPPVAPPLAPLLCFCFPRFNAGFVSAEDEWKKRARYANTAAPPCQPGVRAIGVFSCRFPGVDAPPPHRCLHGR